jgi:hypothetical protein
MYGMGITRATAKGTRAASLSFYHKTRYASQYHRAHRTNEDGHEARLSHQSFPTTSRPARAHQSIRSFQTIRFLLN